jgi:broad specificity phosphatase PhoE
MNKVQRVYLVCAGKTRQEESKFWGAVDSSLSGEGREQAKAAAKVLSPVSFELLATSPLQNAVYTSSLINGEQKDKNLAPPMMVPLLTEVSRGRWVGLSPDEIKENYPGDLESFIKDSTWREHGGECYEDLSHRVNRAIDILLSTSAEDLGIVSHCYAITAVVAKCTGLEPTFINFAHINIPPGSITRIDYSNNTPTVRFIGQDPQTLGDPKKPLSNSSATELDKLRAEAYEAALVIKRSQEEKSKQVL